jgi:hypothetical protein
MGAKSLHWNRSPAVGMSHDQTAPLPAGITWTTPFDGSMSIVSAFHKAADGIAAKQLL